MATLFLGTAVRPSNIFAQHRQPQKIKTISLLLPYGLGSANCYLISTNAGYVLIDTGCPNMRTGLEKELESAGCKPGNLQVIVLTHGDFDHTGNAAYLRKKFGATVVMHHDDSGMVERGNMFWNRKKSNILISLIRMTGPILFKFGKSERFKPDSYCEDGESLSEYGFDATVLGIPGRSKGSIGILTAAGDLICGDLLENRNDPAAANASIAKLCSLRVTTVYPGHGKPFPWEQFEQLSATAGQNGH